MYAFCSFCQKVRLFFYRFHEAHFECSECKHIEKFPQKP